MDIGGSVKVQCPVDPSFDDSSPDAIGLHGMIHGDDSFGSTNNCTAIVPFGPPHVATDSLTSATQTGDCSSAPRDANGIGFAGLVNSGMTCYMNSLLQTLYMTPEFRNALYCWRFQGTEAEAVTSIPYQLQKLFVQLYATKNTAVSTTGVTTSFGWRTTDVFQQQDIHELCRVMFDALEKKLGTGNLNQTPSCTSTIAYPSSTDSSTHAPTHDLINRLYQGERSDCVRCMACNRVSCRPDTFLDIQVPLRPFEINAEPYDSLETAFRALIKPERLDGSNQYYCSRCQTKRDAERVAAFHRMPYLLTLQLMRFTFDLTTMNRIKINDRFTFPLDRWDLSEFITAAPQDHASYEDEESLDDCGTEDGTDYIETENEYEVASGAASSNGRLTNDRHVHRVEDEFEEMDIGNGDSGVNSSTTDSPCDAGFSGSPTGESSNNEEHILDFPQPNGENRTITASLPSGLAFERAIGSAVRNHASLNGIQTDHSVDTDEDDGFGTGDARSACSSATNSSSVNGSHVKSADDAKLAYPIQARSRHKSNSGRWAGTDEPTPTKDRKSLAHELSARHELQKPSSVYELFSIMVHSGFINGGHYYAYIKSFTDNQWYCFNDKTVTRADRSDLEETFGSSQAYTSRANAYFLMYRRVDPAVNEGFLPPEKFPQHICEMLEAVRQEEAESQRKRELELSVCRFEAFTRCPATQQTVQAVVNLYKDQTMAEAADIVRQALLPDCTALRPPHCRLVQYNASTDSLGKSAEYTLWHRPAGNTGSLSNGNSSEPTHQTDSAQPPPFEVCTSEPNAVKNDAASLVTVGEFAENKRLYPFKLWLEHCLNVPGATNLNGSNAVVSWKAYEPKGLTIQLSRVDIGQRLVYSPLKLWFSSIATVAELMNETWQLFTGSRATVLPNDTGDEISSCRPCWGAQFQLIADQSCHGPRDRWIQQGFPEWAFLLSSGVHHNTKLASLFTESIVDLSNSYNYQKGETARVYVDLGPEFDNFSGQCSTEDRLSIDSDAKRGRWQSGVPESLDLRTDSYRLHHLARIVDEHLFVIEVPLQYPTQGEIDLALVQWQLLYSDSVPMDLDDCLPTSSPGTGGDEPTVEECHTTLAELTNPAAWSDLLLKNKHCGTAGYQVSTTASNVSSTDSGCSVAAHCGSSEQSASPFGSPRPLCRRRTNSQSHLDQLKTDEQRLQRRSLSSSYTNLPLQGERAMSVDTAEASGVLTNSLSVNKQWLSDSSKPVRLCIFEPVSMDSLSPSSTSDAMQSLRVRFDKRLSVEQFICCLANHLNLELDRVKIQVSVNQRNLSGDLGQITATDTLRVAIECAFDTDVKKLSLRVLDLTGLKSASSTDHSNSIKTRLSPVWDDRISLFCRANWTVDRILASVAILLRTVHHLNLPVSRLRLRKCGSIEPTPGPMLSPGDVFSTFYNPHQGLMVQFMPTDPTEVERSNLSDHETATKNQISSPSASAGFVFARRWYPSTMSFDAHWHEVIIPASTDRPTRWEVIVSWMTKQSGLPADRLSIARCNFPGVTQLWSMYEWSTDSSALTWHSCASYNALLSPVPNNGQVVYFKDSGEVYSGHSTGNPTGPSDPQKSHTHQTKMESSPFGSDTPISYGPHLPSTSGTLPTSSSYGNMYSIGVTRSDYEQPLRIYTAEDALPSMSSLQPTSLRPSSLHTAKRRESKTP
ncbi:ubiquitin carboxyl-terminal hydrolase 47 [Clonorchis sinensis]|uniref:Ubiquitin carboxyl-terminal hydrolase 47 n=1 Tax=Clonorchis sinensis TaxID=79923 RepID=H2KVF7_CLOSI|nr:ubiquitin carboxyl-terminal hydrolase 47 [Clonorchis sinensis]